MYTTRFLAFTEHLESEDPRPRDFFLGGGDIDGDGLDDLLYSRAQDVPHRPDEAKELYNVGITYVLFSPYARDAPIPHDREVP